MFVEQLGIRACGLNGFKTERGVRLVAQHGDRLEILYGKHPYKVEFNPAPKVNTESEKPKKRLLSQESEEEDEAQSSKKSKMNDDTADQVNMEGNDSIETASTTSSNGNMSKSENGTWEHYSNKTLYVYTSDGCQGRSKVSLILFKFCFIWQ